MLDLLTEAVAYACHQHRDQKRKFTGAPYFSHPCEVAQVLAEAGCSTHQIAVGYLHDTIEDTGATEADLLARFPRELVADVMAVSDPKDVPSEVRKAQRRERLALAPGRVQDVAIADMISNCATVAQLSPEFAARYLPEKRALFEVLVDARPQLRTRLDQILTNNGY